MSEEQKKPQVNASTKDKSLMSGLAEYAMTTYVVPKMKDLTHDMLSGFASMINDVVQGSLNKVIYGDDKPRARSNGTTTNYSSYYTRPSSPTGGVTTISRNQTPIGQRSSTEVKLIWVDTEEDAKTIVDGLSSLVNQYGKAKVADLYEMLNPKPTITFTDYQYGWTDISNFSYRKEYTGEHRGQWFIDLTQPIDVKNV